MDVNMGSILENVFAQSIKSNGFSLNYFPWYMVMFYQREKEPENYIYEVDLSGL